MISYVIFNPEMKKYFIAYQNGVFGRLLLLIFICMYTHDPACKKEPKSIVCGEIVVHIIMNGRLKNDFDIFRFDWAKWNDSEMNGWIKLWCSLVYTGRVTNI